MPFSLDPTIDQANVCIFLAECCIEAACIQKMTREKILKSILACCLRVEEGEKGNLINEVVSKLSMKTGTTEADDTIWSLYGEFSQALRNEGIENRWVTRPHMAMKRTLLTLETRYLKKNIADIILWRKNEQLYKKNFNGFTRRIPQQTDQLRGKKKASMIGLLLVPLSDEKRERVNAPKICE